MHIKKLIELIRNSKGQTMSMRRKLMLYMLLLLLTAVGILATAFIATGVIGVDDDRIYEGMHMRLDQEESLINEEIDSIIVQGIDLAQNIGRETQTILTNNNVTIDKLNNNIDTLYDLQSSYYGYMNTAIQMSGASGVFVVLDATANTNIENSDRSRSGVYLRVSNIDLKEQVNKELNLYRGIAEIGRDKGLRMNNQWQMEFDMDRTPFTIPRFKVNDISRSYQLSSRFKLQNMWEEVIMLSVPFTASEGTVYGQCGLELSEALFSLKHPALESEFGALITVLAPYDGENLYVDKGLIGGTQDTFITDKENFKVSGDKRFFKLSGDYGDYICVMKDVKASALPGVIKVSGLSKDEDSDDVSSDIASEGQPQDEIEIAGQKSEDDTESVLGKEYEKEVTWKLCVLIPESDYHAFIRSSRLRWLTIAAVFMIVMLIACLIISRRYVEPIVNGMEALKGTVDGESIKTGYSEIDELIEFMKSKEDDEVIVEEKLPENISILFDNFAENVKKLSPAEWVVMRLYIEGHEIAEIPDLAYISITTVRKHNRSIYEKLEVASRDELMLYIDLFRRCNRLEELTENDTGFTD
ncbi:MAG: helix-turn-helix transcriptional regulator [Eubacterium sp.]|nr:helix-turn-helix transcriptional regulator [Eubacterium sp.]